MLHCHYVFALDINVGATKHKKDEANNPSCKTRKRFRQPCHLGFGVIVFLLSSSTRSKLLLCCTHHHTVKNLSKTAIGSNAIQSKITSLRALSSITRLQPSTRQLTLKDHSIQGIHSKVIRLLAATPPPPSPHPATTHPPLSHHTPTHHQPPSGAPCLSK